MKALGLVAVLLAVGLIAWWLLGADAGPGGQDDVVEDATRDKTKPTLLAAGEQKPTATQDPNHTPGTTASDPASEDAATPHHVAWAASKACPRQRWPRPRSPYCPWAITIG